jgi:hypothetical protein
VRAATRSTSGLFASGRAGRLDVLLPRDSAGAPRAASEPEHPRARYVSGNYFGVLQVRAAPRPRVRRRGGPRTGRVADRGAEPRLLAAPLRRRPGRRRQRDHRERACR